MSKGHCRLSIKLFGRNHERMQSFGLFFGLPLIPKHMNSYRQSLYHIVFCTYYRQDVLPEKYHEELYKYIWGIIDKRACVLYRINGTENHIHIISDLHPTICLSDYIKEIKTASNR